MTLLKIRLLKHLQLNAALLTKKLPKAELNIAAAWRKEKKRNITNGKAALIKEQYVISPPNKLLDSPSADTETIRQLATASEIASGL